MAVIKPFAALRPDPAVAGRICELPYDVVSTEEARCLAENNPLSFFHVSKPEIDLPPGTPVAAPEVYATGRRRFEQLQTAGHLRRDAAPGFYLYRQQMGAHSQTGLVALASCEEYRRGIVRKHELTRPDKEADRARHIEVLAAQTGPAFLVYRAVPALDRFVQAHSARPPAVDFVAPDGVRHTAWVVAEPGDQAFLVREFAAVPILYIADGHHRSAAAARVAQQRGGAGGSEGFLAVIFPHPQTQILPYHRVVKDLAGLAAGTFLERLRAVGTLDPRGEWQPRAKHELGLYLAGRWHSLRFHPALTDRGEPGAQLDVALLQQHVLGPLLGIDDPRTSQRLQFVGGIRGTAELERVVDAGEFAAAFSLHPTGIEDLMRIADEGGIMPPKSTWFEPKLRDGLFCHCLA